jgi:hypothetical protein
MFIFNVLSGRVNSPTLLSVLNLIASRYPTRGTEFLRFDFHQTNYEIHEPMSSVMRQFNEVIGLFDFKPQILCKCLKEYTKSLKKLQSILKSLNFSDFIFKMPRIFQKKSLAFSNKKKPSGICRIATMARGGPASMLIFQSPLST